MKRILCFGDSNTWGMVPGKKGERYDECARYTSLLKKRLGVGFEVIEEGLRSRTLASEDIKFPKGNRNGSEIFGQCLYTHDPLDFVVIFLGVNDLKAVHNKTVEELCVSLKENYIDFLNNVMRDELIKVPKIIIVAPSEIKEVLADFAGGEEKSRKFGELYRKTALENGCLFVGNGFLKVGCDGVHLTRESHVALSEKLAETILANIYGKS